MMICRSPLLIALALVLGCAACDSIPNDQAVAKYADSHSKFTRVQGMNIHYKDEGQGPPVLLIHGVLASLHTWDGWVAKLESSHRLVRLDLPGFGLSDPLPSARHSPSHSPGYSPSYSINDYVSVVLGLLDQLGIQSCAIAGNSLGGWIAWELAAAHPERVEKLILIDAAGYHLDDVPLPIRLAQLPLVQLGVLFFTPNAFVEKIVQSTYGDPSRVSAETIRRYRDLFLREGNRQAFIDFSNSVVRDDTARIKTIRAPTLILWGKKDHWIDPKNADLFARDLPHAKLKMYDDLGHIGMEENPELTAKDAAEFLDSKVLTP